MHEILSADFAHSSDIPNRNAYATASQKTLRPVFTITYGHFVRFHRPVFWKCFPLLYTKKPPIRADQGFPQSSFLPDYLAILGLIYAVAIAVGQDLNTWPHDPRIELLTVLQEFTDLPPGNRHGIFSVIAFPTQSRP